MNKMTEVAKIICQRIDEGQIKVIQTNKRVAYGFGYQLKDLEKSAVIAVNGNRVTFFDSGHAKEGRQMIIDKVQQMVEQGKYEKRQNFRECRGNKLTDTYL